MAYHQHFKGTDPGIAIFYDENPVAMPWDIHDGSSDPANRLAGISHAQARNNPDFIRHVQQNPDDWVRTDAGYIAAQRPSNGWGTAFVFYPSSQDTRLPMIQDAMNRAFVMATKGCATARSGAFDYTCTPEDKATCEACATSKPDHT